MSELLTIPYSEEIEALFFKASQREFNILDSMFDTFNEALFNNELEYIEPGGIDNLDFKDRNGDYYPGTDKGTQKGEDDPFCYGLFEVVRGHQNIYINSDLFGRYDYNSLSWVATVLLHEMVHGYLYQHGHGADYEHGELFQREAIRRGLSPALMTERARKVFNNWFTTRGQE